MKNAIKIGILLCIVMRIDSVNIDQKQFDRLFEVKCEKEKELVGLAKCLYDEIGMENSYEIGALMLWNPVLGKDKEASFKEFITKLANLYEVGGDTKKLLSEAPLDRDSGQDVDLIMHRLAIQKLYVSKMTSQYRKSVEELRQVSQEIQKLIDAYKKS